MDAKTKAIVEIFHNNGCDIFPDDIWKVQGTPVVTHKALERLAARMDIDWELPKVIRAERDEAVVLVSAKRGGKLQWSIGEATITDGTKPGNYRVSGKQAAYPYAMAEKRAKDRVIIKLAGIEASSEEESEDLKREKADIGDAGVPASGGGQEAGTLPAPDTGTDSQPAPREQGDSVAPDPTASDEYDIMETLLKQLTRVKAAREALELMLTESFQIDLGRLAQDNQVAVMAAGIRKMFEVCDTVEKVSQIAKSATVIGWLDKLGVNVKEQTLDFGRKVHTAIKDGKPKPEAIPNA